MGMNKWRTKNAITVVSTITAVPHRTLWTDKKKLKSLNPKFITFLEKVATLLKNKKKKNFTVLEKFQDDSKIEEKAQ